MGGGERERERESSPDEKDTERAREREFSQEEEKSCRFWCMPWQYCTCHDVTMYCLLFTCLISLPHDCMEDNEKLDAKHS